MNNKQREYFVDQYMKHNRKINGKAMAIPCDKSINARINNYV